MFGLPGLTIRHLFDFQADSAAVQGRLDRQAWDRLRFETSGPFAMPVDRRELERIARTTPGLAARAAAIDALLDAEQAGSVASYGVGGAVVELLLIQRRPSRDWTLSEYAPATLERLRVLLPEASVAEHDLASDPPLPADLHLFHRLDPELSNRQWQALFYRFATQRVLFVAAGISRPHHLAQELLRRPRMRARGAASDGWMRTRGAYKGFWRETQRQRRLRFGDLDGWLLTPHS